MLDLRFSGPDPYRASAGAELFGGRLATEPGVARQHDRQRPAVDAELVEDDGHAVAHRLGADTEPPPDCAVVKTGGQKLEDLYPARCQRVEHAGFRRPIRYAGQEAVDLGDE